MTPAERIALARSYVADGRVIQKSWRKHRDGREYVCALAMFGRDINDASDCPADLMPQWLAELIPALDDMIAAGDVPWFAAGLVERAEKWSNLTPEAWERVRIAFLTACIRAALASAETIQPDPKPTYWQPVVDACEGVIRALHGDGDLLTARDAAWAAAADANANASAAWTAATAAARDAAWAAAWAAYAAATAADVWAVATRLAEALFALIDKETDDAR